MWSAQQACLSGVCACVARGPELLLLLAHHGMRVGPHVRDLAFAADRASISGTKSLDSRKQDTPLEVRRLCQYEPRYDASSPRCRQYPQAQD